MVIKDDMTIEEPVAAATQAVKTNISMPATKNPANIS